MKKKTTSSGKQWRFAGEAAVEEALSPAEERIFTEIISVYRDFPVIDERYPVGLSAAETRAREAAARAAIPFFLRRFEKSYQREEILSALATAVSLPIRFSEWFLNSDSALTGAAFWLLDYIEQQDLYDELYQLLPDLNAAALEEMERRIPPASDLSHSRQTLLRTAYVLTEREKSGMKKLCRKLLGMIDKKEAARLKSVFRDALMDYFGRFLEVRTRIKPSSDSPESPSPLSVGHSDSRLNIAESSRLPRPASLPDDPYKPGPLSVNLPDSSRVSKTLPAGLSDGFRASRNASLEIIPPPSRPVPPPDARESAEPPERGPSFLSDIQTLFRASPDLSDMPWGKKLLRGHPDLIFLMKTPAMIGLSEDRLREEFYYRRMTSLLSGFTVRDPYEICAACLLLERDNDILFHLSALTAAVRVCAERNLPWSPDPEESSALCAETRTPDYTPRYLFRHPEDINKNAGENPVENTIGEEIEKDRMVSEAQLFYLAAGFLPPRDRIPSKRLAEWFEKQGLEPERANALAYAAHMVSRLKESRERGETAPPRADASGQAETDGPEAGEESNVPADTRENAELSKQLKAARESQHDAEQKVRQLQERLEREEARSARDRMELNGLRETIFRMKSGEIPERRPADENIEFPWQGKRKILVFGGHDAWSKSIRPLLPGVRFFDRESLPDLNAVKGADVVWIQANALSHKFYYRVIDAARRENIPVQYFGFASARKCAEQLVSYELSGGAPEEI